MIVTRSWARAGRRPRHHLGCIHGRASRADHIGGGPKQASTTQATVALQRETRTIPIVFATVTDPVASSIVARLDRPSGNITGFANFEASMGGKGPELLSEIAPGLKRANLPARI